MQRIRKKYLSLGSCAATIALLAAVPAHATTVDYTTTGMFNCTGCMITDNGSGDVKVVYGTGANTAMLEFFGAPSGTNVDSSGSFVSAGFGYFQASATGGGSSINGAFTLAIQQIGAPTLTGAFAAATLSGLISNTRSTTYANFGSSPDPEVTLGGPVTYELDTSKNFNNKTQFGYTIVSPSTGKGRTSLQGNISANLQGTIAATPEPGLLTLTGAGFFGLATLASRRRRQIS
jgi:hypothetical protein